MLQYARRMTCSNFRCRDKHCRKRQVHRLISQYASLTDATCMPVTRHTNNFFSQVQPLQLTLSTTFTGTRPPSTDDLTRKPPRFTPQLQSLAASQLRSWTCAHVRFPYSSCPWRYLTYGMILFSSIELPTRTQIRHVRQLIWSCNLHIHLRDTYSG